MAQDTLHQTQDDPKQGLHELARNQTVVMVPAGLFLVVVGLGVGFISPRWRRRTAKYLAMVLGAVLGLYLVGRGIAEFWRIDFSRPETYRNDWGGPNLAGVLAVHAGPALVIVVVALVFIGRWWRRKVAADLVRG